VASVSGPSDAATGTPATVPAALATLRQIYIVQRGDSLWRIGVRYDVTVAALKAANNLVSNIIYPGQALVIPGVLPAAGDPPTAAASATELTGDSPPIETAGPQPTIVAVTSEPTQPPPTDAAPGDTPTAVSTEAPAPTASPLPTDAPTALPSPTSTTAAPTETVAVPTGTPLPEPSPTIAPVGDPLNCAVPNIAWSAPGQLLRGGRPEAHAFACLAAAGVDTLVDQRPPGEDLLDEPLLAAEAGLEYINAGIADDTAPSPAMLRIWIDTVAARLAEGKVVLVHDAAGRGRMGFWDAVFFMRNGSGAAAAIEDRYLAKALPFDGAKIGCTDGGRGQVQALAEVAAILTGAAYYPAVDEYGTAWANCPRPGYMDGWDYSTVLP
jgi:LysM repeat protein